ncbi:NfeD family protein [Spongiibacter sp.]|uniref:NfeD family protein n=1 Tax=Spongiibacter sp. TaxID=2024860 RepID=UPI0035620B9E
MEWLNNNVEYWHWMVLGLLLVASEIFVPSFVMLWFGASAIAVGLISAVVELSFSVQLLIWGGLSVVDLFLWFRFVHPRMKDRSLSGMSREQVIGQEGMVIRAADHGEGCVRFSVPLMGSDEWAYICRETLAVGDRVVVEEISGNSLIVRRQHSAAEQPPR